MIPILGSAQLHIKSSTGGQNAYVYNKGEILFVTQEIGMDGSPSQTGGNLYLREEGQLIQGDDTKTNSGNGILSVYQKNTRNQWDYHYWTSPVGDPGKAVSNNGNGGNTRFYVSNDDLGGLYRTDPTSTLDATPVIFTNSFNSSVTNTNNFSLSSYWLYKFVANTGYGNWGKVTSSNPLLAGEGFTMKGLGDGTGPALIVPIDFRGRPNNGTINVAVVKDNLTLVGNPYPSAMNLSFYLLSNSYDSSLPSEDLPNLSACKGTFSGAPTPAGNTITGLAYFWESDPNVKSHYIQDYQGGYGTFTPLLSCASTGEYSPAVFITYDNEGERVLVKRPNEDENGNPIYFDDNNIPYDYIPEFDENGKVVIDENGNIVYVMDPVPSGIENNVSIPRHISPVGQGFFVEASNTGVVTAKNEFRVFVKETEENGNSQFRNKLESKTKTKTKNYLGKSTLKAGGLTYDEQGILTMPKFRLTTHINDTYYRKLSGVMFDEATMGYDTAGDGDNVNVLPSDISFIVENSSKDVLINLFPYNSEVVLPLKITAAKESNTFDMQVLELNFEPDESIYLHDKVTDEYHDILNRSYEIKLPQGSYPDRYEITFKDFNAVNLDVEEEVKESFAVYQNNSRSELTVLNPLETELKEIDVFDITGKLLVSKLNEGSKSKVVISSSAWSDGIYIIKVITRDNVEFAKKVSVMNLK